MSEKFQFQAETKKLLDLMVSSIYSNKEIFSVKATNERISLIKLEQFFDVRLNAWRRSCC